MYHPFSEIIFPGDKKLTWVEVKSFLLLKWNCTKERDNSLENDFGKESGDLELNVIATTHYSPNNVTDEGNLPDEPIRSNELISDETTPFCSDVGSPILNQTEDDTIESKEIDQQTIEQDPTVSGNDDDGAVDGIGNVNVDGYDDDNYDELRVKLQEIYVLTSTIVAVILFGVIFGILLTSLGLNTQIGNALKHLMGFLS